MPRQIDLSPQNLSVNNDPNNQLGFTQEQVVNLRSQIPVALEKAELEFINAVLQAIDQATGLDLESFTQQAQAGITYTGNLATDLWNYIFGTNTVANEANTLATQAWTELEDFFETGDFSDLTTAMQSIFQAIFGSSTSLGLVGSIPAPAVVNVTQDLQPVFDFPDAQSVSAGGQWSWDGTVDHTGITGSGSALCVANGLLQALKGIPGAVQSGQIVTASGRVQWSGLTYTGSNPVQIQLVPYSRVGSELVAGTPFEVAQLASPASSGSWTYLSGTYTVPSSGVDAVQLRLVVAGNATAGSVWFDDCECNVSGGYLATLQNDLTDLQTDSTASTAAFATFITSVESAISGYTNWSTFIAAIESAWVTYSTAESALTSSAVFTLQNFFNTLLGISPSTGLVSGNKVASSTGLSSLQADWTQVVNFWDNLFGISGANPTTSQVAPGSVGNVLGGASLGSDVSTVHTTAVNGSSWSTRLTNDLLTLLDVFHVTYTSTQWNAAWADLLALFGIVNSVTTPTNPVPTIGSAITSAQSTANTGVTNASTAQTTANTAVTNASTAQSTANTGVTNAATAQTSANTGLSWGTRLTNDLTITSDVFHLVYQAGSSGDAPGTLGTNGKPTWYSAWNDILALNGVVNSVTAPTDPAPTTGASITAAAAAATTAGTNASMALSNASAVATTAQAITDGIYQSQNGGTSTGNPTTTIVPSLTNIPASNIVGQHGATPVFGALGAGNKTSGTLASPQSISFTHTPVATDTMVVVLLEGTGPGNSSNGSGVTMSATYGGTAMTAVGPILVTGGKNSSGDWGYAQAFTYKITAGTTSTSTVAAQISGGGVYNLTEFMGNSYSCSASKVSNYDYTIAAAPTSPASQTITGTDSSKLLIGFFGGISIGAWSSFTGGTQRYNQQGAGTYGAESACAFGDTTPGSGVTSVTFSAAHVATSNSQFLGMILELSN
jgi:hypothetical protein